MSKSKKILATSALMYANGDLHLGHMVEAIQTDIWVRTQRMLGHTCYYICGDDAHGTPIMISAEKLGIKPEQMIQDVKARHEADFAGFAISVDFYGTTHSPENREFSSLIYERLKARGDITTKTIEQAFDPEKQMFLPDRFIKGTCPKCGAHDQYGDNCEVCGATYTTAEILNPVSAVSGATPIHKESLHYFFSLDHYQEFLEQWFEHDHVQAAAKNKLKEWLDSGLEKWDISRDKPYFGFEIPDAPGKYFYVWLDAPIGYMASFKRFCDENDLAFDEFWKPDSEAELHHFIGKDIVYFHALFWPAMLHGADFRTPTNIYCHGFLTVEGAKMSKSRGTFIKARTYLNHLNPEYLRYYFAAKLSNSVEDIDLNWEDFKFRVNSDIVGKVVNIASRCAGFIVKKFDATLASELPEPKLQTTLTDASEIIKQAYLDREYGRAIRHIMELADKVNQYIDDKKPWALAKDENTLAEVQGICTQGLNAFKVLITYLKPVLPTVAEQSEEFLNCDAFDWKSVHTQLLAHKINKFKPLIHRVEQDSIDALKADSTSS